MRADPTAFSASQAYHPESDSTADDSSSWRPDPGSRSLRRSAVIGCPSLSQLELGGGIPRMGQSSTTLLPLVTSTSFTDSLVSMFAATMYSHRRTQILQWRGFTWCGGSEGSGTEVSTGVQGQSPGKRSGERRPRKLRQNCEISVQIFNVFVYKF